MATLFFEQLLTPVGWLENARIAIAEGRIAGIETGVAPASGDECHAIGLPGLPNLHSHAFQRGMAGLAEQRGTDTDSFWTWREVMYRFLGQMTPDDVEAVAALAYVEMLETGFTRVGEFHYLHHDIDGRPYTDCAELAARIAAAAEQTGLALTLLPVFYAHGGFGAQPPNAGQRRFINHRDGYARLLERSRAAIRTLPDANWGVAPHSLRAATLDEIRFVAELAADRPIHIHIAEQRREVEDCLRAHGCRSVEYLASSLALNPQWCLIHATHVTAEETLTVARSGAVAGLCPVTEANLGDGIFPARDFVDAGGRFGVGTDSNVLIGVGDELRQLEYSQRLRDQARNVLARENGSTGRRLFEAALHGGAQALGVSAVGLVAGAPADLVSLDASHPSLVGRRGDALLDSLVFAASSGVIDHVWRAGRQVVRAGRHVARDSIRARYRATLSRLLAA